MKKLKNQNVFEINSLKNGIIGRVFNENSLSKEQKKFVEKKLTNFISKKYEFLPKEMKNNVKKKYFVKVIKNEGEDLKKKKKTSGKKKESIKKLKLKQKIPKNEKSNKFTNFFVPPSSYISKTEVNVLNSTGHYPHLHPIPSEEEAKLRNAIKKVRKIDLSCERWDSYR